MAIVGRPNVGKSSLFNALVGAPRAIVTDVPGTTRDLVTEVVDIHGARVTLVDTAGCAWRGMSSRRKASRVRDEATAVADLVLIVVDAATNPTPSCSSSVTKNFIVQNKCDLGRVPTAACRSLP